MRVQPGAPAAPSRGPAAPMDLAAFEAAAQEAARPAAPPVPPRPAPGGAVPAAGPPRATVTPAPRAPVPPVPPRGGDGGPEGDVLEISDAHPDDTRGGYGLMLVGVPPASRAKLIPLMAEVMGCAEPIVQGLLRKKVIHVLTDAPEKQVRDAAKRLAAIGVAAKVMVPKYHR